MSDLRTVEHRTLALAGIYQSVALVDDIARHGDAPAAEQETLIASVFRQDADSVLAIYAGTDMPAHRALARGLQLLSESLSAGGHRQLTAYAMTVLQLEGKLRGKPAILNKIGAGIANSEEQGRYFGATHENVLARLADLYVNTVSTLTPRINVFGEPMHLEQPHNKNSIRALLLAAIRSAVLWRQCGGSRWKLLLERRQIVNTATALLDVA